MTTIRIRPEELRRTADMVSEAADRVVAAVTDVDSVVRQVDPGFDGHRADAFNRRYQRACRELQMWDDLLRSFAASLNVAADAFEQADRPDNSVPVPPPIITPPAEPPAPPPVNPPPVPPPAVTPAGPPGPAYFGNGVNPQHPAIGGAARPPSVDANGYGNWGGYNVGQLVRMIDDPNAPWMNAANASPDRIRAIIRYLNPGGPNDPTAPDSLRYQGPPAGTCNAFAKDAMWLMGAPLPYHAAANEGWANNRSVTQQHQWLLANSQPLSDNPGTGWYRVTPQQAQAFANQGQPALQINDGHVALVAPEPVGENRGGNPPYVAEGGAPSTLSNGAYRSNRGKYDHFVYVY